MLTEKSPTKILTKRDDIAAYRQQYPYATQVDISLAVGLSRERVRQLLRMMGLPAVVKNPVKEAQRRYSCDSCGEDIRIERKVRLKHKYCDRVCYSAAHVVTIECAICSELFTMSISQWISRSIRNNTLTCSMACRGITIGRQVKVQRAKRHWSSTNPVSNRVESVENLEILRRLKGVLLLRMSMLIIDDLIIGDLTSTYNVEVTK